MAIIVQKFGGTSVANPGRIALVAEIIKRQVLAGNQVIVVVSAMAGVTNQLVTYCNELSALDCDEQIAEYDAALSSGEMVSAALTSLALNKIGLKARSLHGWQLPIITDKTYSNALVQKIDATILKDCLAKNIIPIVTGFQGISTEGRLTTLGRGGSDTTAVLLAASMNASSCDIYTDVEGVFTADPRIVHNAKKITELDAEEMLELACSGAKVLQARSASAAARYHVPLKILSSFKPNAGTIIKIKDKTMENSKITAITANKNLLNIAITKPLLSFAEVCASFGVSNIQLNFADNLAAAGYRMIANLNDKNKITALLDAWQAQAKIANYNIAANIVCISIIGYGIKNDHNLISQILKLLIEEQIEIMQISSSETKIAFLTDENYTERAVKLIHDHFITNE